MKKRIILISLICVVILTFFSGCDGQKHYAKVGDTYITEMDFMYSRILRDAGRKKGTGHMNDFYNTDEWVLRQIVKNELYYQYALKEGIEFSEEANARVEALYSERFDSETGHFYDAKRAFMSKYSMNEEEFREYACSQIKREVMAVDGMQQILTEYYLEHSDCCISCTNNSVRIILDERKLWELSKEYNVEWYYGQ